MPGEPSSSGIQTTQKFQAKLAFAKLGKYLFGNGLQGVKDA